MADGAEKVVPLPPAPAPPPLAAVLELKISMNCRACERSVLNSLRSLKGVEGVSTDMKTQTAVVKGRVDPQKILKKLKKRTGKRAEILTKRNDGGGGGGACSLSSAGEDSAADELFLGFDAFSDENPNATCDVM